MCFGLFVVLGLTVILSEFQEQIRESWLYGLDRLIQAYVHNFTSPELTTAMFALSFIGSWKIMLPAIAALFSWFLSKGNQRDALVWVLSVAGGAAINVALKLWFQRERPSVPWALAHESSYSFPSGHSVTAVVFYGAIALLAYRRFKGRPTTVLIIVAALFMILGIGLSRIYLGVHFPTDVAAGYLVGAIWLGVVRIAERQLQPRPVRHI
jgi:undecaprenyl-diphosphatase